jgi:hypothetical protein
VGSGGHVRRDPPPEEALKAKGKAGKNFLVMGPWRHSQINRERLAASARSSGMAIPRAVPPEMVLPFFNRYLKDGPAFTPGQGKRSTIPARIAGTI